MKQYVVDELRPSDRQKIDKYLREKFDASVMDGIYWIPLQENLLSEAQAAHKDCQPFVFAVDLGEDQISVELLIRTRNRIRCSCIGYASPEQREWILQYIDSIFEALEVIT